MNSFEPTVVLSMPAGEFREIDILLPDWEKQFLKFIQERKNIRYNVFSMPKIPEHILDELNGRHYHHVILENNTWLHFLICDKETP